VSIRLEAPTWLIAGLLAMALAIGLVAGVDPPIAAAVAIGLGFVVLVLLDLTLGVCALALLGFLEVLPKIGNLSMAKLAGALLVLSWIGYVSTREHSRGLLAERPAFAYVLLMFIGWAAITLAWADNRGASLHALSRYAPNLVLFPVVFTAVRSRRDVVRILGAVVIGAAIAAAVGILKPPSAGAVADAGRATGTIGDANELAAALIVGLFVAGGFAVTRGIDGRARAASALVVPLCLAGILLSLSRGGLIAVAAAAAVAVIVAGRWRARASLLATVVVATGLFYFTLLAPPVAQERVTQVAGGTGRIDLWTVGGRMVEAHPIRGIGVGNFASSSIHYLLRPGIITRADFIITTPKVAHNTYLQVLAEMGAPGLALFLAIIGFALGSTLLAARRFERAGATELEILCRALFVGLFGYLVASFFISEMYSKIMWVLLAMGPPLLVLANRQLRDVSAPEEAPPGAASRPAAAS